MTEEELRAQRLAALSGSTAAPGAALPAVQTVEVSPELQARRAAQSRQASEQAATFARGALPISAAQPVEAGRGADVTEPGAAYEIEPGQEERFRASVDHNTGRVSFLDRLGRPQGGFVLTPEMQANPDLIRAQYGPEIHAQVLRQLGFADTPAARAPQAPPGRIQMSLSETRRGTPSADTAAGLAEASDATRAAQRAVDLAEQNLAQTGVRTQRALAEEQAAQQAEMVAQEQERRRALAQRMQRFDESLRRVAEQRIDPEGFFGGDFGRRLGAGIVVALGQFASGLTGGENAALGIINRAIDRNIAAQRDNMSNARSSAALEGQALSQYRSLLGDERAAEAAARAAHLQAVVSRLSGMMANARADQVAPMQRLRDALQEQQALAARAAQEIADTTFTSTRSVDMRVDPRRADPAGTFARRLVANLPPEEQRRIREEAARDRAERIIASGNSPAARRARRRIERRERRLNGRDILRREGGVITVDREAAESSLASARELTTTEQAQSVPDLEAGGVFDVDEEAFNARARFLEGEARGRLVQTASETRQMLGLIRDITRLREDRSLWEALTDTRRNALIRGMASRGQAMIRGRDGFGVVNSPAEIERIEGIFGDLERSDVNDWATFRNVAGQLESEQRLWVERARAELEPFGIHVRAPVNTIRNRIGDFADDVPERDPDPEAARRRTRERARRIADMPAAAPPSSRASLSGQVGGVRSVSVPGARLR